MSWSAVDYLQLRDEYETTVAAAGDTERIDEEGWLQNTTHWRIASSKMVRRKQRAPRKTFLNSREAVPADHVEGGCGSRIRVPAMS